MTPQELTQACQYHMSIQNSNYVTGIYQKYALEELKFSENQAEFFSQEIPKADCDKKLQQYQSPNQKTLFYFWYYANHCAKYFNNGFAEWLKVYNRILQYMQQNWGLKLVGLSVKNSQEKDTIDIYSLAENWTNEFELQYQGQDWKRKDFNQAVISFCEERLISSYNNLYEYLRPYAGELYRIINDEITYVSWSQIEDLFKNNDPYIYFVHTGLIYHNLTNDRETFETNVNIFLEKHGRSEFVNLVERENDYHAICISILCNDKNIIKDLIKLDSSGTLLRH
jgi:hypothetical protein